MTTSKSNPNGLSVNQLSSYNQNREYHDEVYPSRQPRIQSKIGANSFNKISNENDYMIVGSSPASLKFHPIKSNTEVNKILMQFHLL